MSQHWPRGFAVKSGGQEVPSSFPGSAYRPSRSEFSIVFSANRINLEQDPLERPSLSWIVPRAGSRL